VLFYAAEPTGAEALAAKSALLEVARRHGTALVDLSPKSEAPPAAPRLLVRGIEAYHAIQYDAALAHLDAALSEARVSGGAGLGPSELSDLLLYRALVLTERGDAARAWDDFVRAAVLDPTRQLDPVRYAPRVIETFGRAGVGVAAKPSATVAIEGADACAVTLDGLVWQPGESRRVVYGEHFLRVVCPGHEVHGATRLFDQPEQRVRPALRRHRAVTATTAVKEARRRAVRTALFAVVTTAPTLVTLHVLGVASGRERARVTISVGDAGEGVAAVSQAAARLIADVVASRTVAGATPWYAKPWVWGLGGAALATIILAPLAFDAGGSSGFDVELGGAVP
jgi:hypothetical protein